MGEQFSEYRRYDRSRRAVISTSRDFSFTKPDSEIGAMDWRDLQLATKGLGMGCHR